MPQSGAPFPHRISAALRDDGLAQLCVHLRINTSVTDLNVAGNFITNNGLRELTNLYRVNSFITWLSLRANAFDGQHVGEFLIVAAKTLKFLDLSCK